MNTWSMILFNSIILFFLAIIISKYLKRKTLARATPFDFISYAVIASIITLISLNMISNIYFGLTVLAIWVFMPIILDYSAMKSKWIYNVIHGKERVLIKNGKVMEDNLSKERITGQEFLQQMRSKKAFNLADVEFAVMETTGDINVILKADKKPVTASDLGKKVGQKREPQTVILDGNILNEGLTNAGLNRTWLTTQLEIKGVSLENVFLGQVDSSGDLYIDLFDDMIQVPKTEIKDMLYASIEKCQSDFMSFSLDSDNDEAKNMYSQDADKLKKIMKKLEPYLLR
jgi:Predicted membrane protein